MKAKPDNRAREEYRGFTILLTGNSLGVGYWIKDKMELNKMLSKGLLSGALSTLEECKELIDFKLSTIGSIRTNDNQTALS